MTHDELPDLVRRAQQRPVAPERWAEPARLRLRAYRRRRRRLVGGVASSLAVATAVSLAIALPGGSAPPRAPEGMHVPAGVHVAARSGIAAKLVADVSTRGGAKPETAAATAVARAEERFALRLLTQVSRSRRGTNVAVSPSSLAVTLAMLENGAAGQTRRQIAAVLGTFGLDLGRQNAGWAALTADLERAGKRGGLTLNTANSLWLQRNFPMTPKFMATLGRDYGAGVWQVDFAQRTDQAVEAINDWVREKTHGKIEKLFRPGTLDASTRLVLANAVYFKATWQYQFERKRTQDGTFVTGSGQKVTVPFMSYGGDAPKLASAHTPAYTAVQLPYTGGRFAALAVMPKNGSISAYAETLTPAALKEIVAGLRVRPAYLRFPKFTLMHDVVLNTLLGQMGMGSAFGSGADFSAMSPASPRLQTIEQRTYLKVDESGTEATAVTGAAMATAGHVETVFDHPFLFLIRDTKTGAILFAAQVGNPAA